MAAGMGLTMAPATDSVMGSLPLFKAGVGSAVNDTTRQVGGALGVAVIGSVLATTYGDKITGFFAGTPVPSQVVDAASNSIGAVPTVAQQLTENGLGDVADQLQDGGQHGLRRRGPLGRHRGRHGHRHRRGDRPRVPPGPGPTPRTARSRSTSTPRSTPASSTVAPVAGSVARGRLSPSWTSRPTTPKGRRSGGPAAPRPTTPSPTPRSPCSPRPGSRGSRSRPSPSGPGSPAPPSTGATRASPSCSSSVLAHECRAPVDDPDTGSVVGDLTAVAEGLHRALHLHRARPGPPRGHRRRRPAPRGGRRPPHVRGQPTPGLPRRGAPGASSGARSTPRSTPTRSSTSWSARSSTAGS